MCDPITGLAVASFAINVGSQIAGASAQNKAAQANKEAAEAAFRTTFNDINALQTSVRERETVSVFELERQGRAAEAIAVVSAGESGVSGQSVKAVIADVKAKFGEAAARTERNADFEVAQLEKEKVSGRQVMQQRIASVPGASPLATGLGVLGAGLDSALLIRRTKTTPTGGN